MKKILAALIFTVVAATTFADIYRVNKVGKGFEVFVQERSFGVDEIWYTENMDTTDFVGTKYEIEKLNLQMTAPDLNGILKRDERGFPIIEKAEELVNLYNEITGTSIKTTADNANEIINQISGLSIYGVKLPTALATKIANRYVSEILGLDKKNAFDKGFILPQEITKIQKGEKILAVMHGAKLKLN